MTSTRPGHVCVAIAVSNPEGNLDVLPGALTAAKQVVAWGRSQGYRTLAITDDPGGTGKATHKVTVDRLCEEILPLIGRDDEEHERIVVAFAGHGVIAGTRDLWLLNDWYSGREEIVDVLLMRHRLATYQYKQVTIISDACRTSLPDEDPTLLGSRVFPRSGWGDVGSTEADVLLATGLGKPAYMAKATPQAPAHCLFTDVVTRALRGEYPKSVDTRHEKGSVVSSQTLKVAVREQIQLAASAKGEQQVAELTTNFTPPDDVYTVLDQASPAASRKVFRGPTPDLFRPSIALDDLDPATASRRQQTEGLAGQIADRVLRAHASAGEIVLVGDVVAEVKLGPHMEATVTRGSADSTGVSVLGAPGSFALRLERTDRWVVGANFPSRTPCISLGAHGANAVLYLPPFGAADTRQTIYAVAALETGDLRGDALLDLAASMRRAKHADPVLGVIAAYLYARGGDTDNVRRMAWYYAERGQPVPLDLILLGALDVEPGPSGLRAIIPSTRDRPPVTRVEAQWDYTHRATPPARADVCGQTPWLREGWALLEDSALPQAEVLAGFTQGLTPAAFTTFTAEAGREFAHWLEKEFD